LLTNAYWGNNICVTAVCQTAVHQQIPMTATYRVSIRQTEEGYSVSCPGLPGCWSEGKTETDALANIREAIVEYVSVAEELAQDGEAEVREVDIAV